MLMRGINTSFLHCVQILGRSKGNLYNQRANSGCFYKKKVQTHRITYAELTREDK